MYMSPLTNSALRAQILAPKAPCTKVENARLDSVPVKELGLVGPSRSQERVAREGELEVMNLRHSYQLLLPTTEEIQRT